VRLRGRAISTSRPAGCSAGGRDEAALVEVVGAAIGGKVHQRFAQFARAIEIAVGAARRAAAGLGDHTFPRVEEVFSSRTQLIFDSRLRLRVGPITVPTTTLDQLLEDRVCELAMLV
jgi:hypothetical protein